MQFSSTFAGLPWYPESKTSYDVLIEQFSIKLEENDKAIVDIPNTALYSPVSYIPQSLAVFVFRKLGFPPVLIFYLTRMFVLIVWVFTFSIVIKFIPTGKWVFALLGLLPMSVFVNMSFSADVVTNILSFLFLSIVLKYKAEPKGYSLKTFIVLLWIAILLSLAKLVYAPLIFIFLLIPSSSFKSKKQRIVQTLIILLSGFIFAFFWAFLVNDFYLPYSGYNPLFRDGITLVNCANAEQQLDFVFSNV
ncbi:MAG: DUF2142 domain-containing protein, partial [Chloroflexia bacterium]|nr:DUF2142 domain-containing protein [Chloroflexia bacterium]